MTAQGKYAFAIDIGTTNITLNLIALEDGSILDQSIIQNPQIQYGTDILRRLRFATKSSDNQKQLVIMTRNAIKSACDRLVDEQDVDSSNVNEFIVVGNTVMHHLFFDLSLESLLRPPYKASHKESIQIQASVIGFDSYQNAQCYSPPIIESFIGPDAIAVLMKSGFYNAPDTRLVIDVGTNTEISLINPEGIWVASAASGPAFEGWSIECGLGGERGAIESVRIDSQTYEPSLKIIGNGNPRGICGTGAISVMAALLESGLLLPRGSFNREIESKWLSSESNIIKYKLTSGKIGPNSRDIFITQPDIRMLQQSKAAIRAAIEILLLKSNSHTQDITNIYLTGIFGTGLNIEDAYRIGMFPYFQNARIHQDRNGAAKGAGMLLFKENRDKVDELMKRLHYIELTEEDTFRELFVASIPFPSK